MDKKLNGISGVVAHPRNITITSYLLDFLVSHQRDV
jgi:hypothetical protein